MRQPFLELPDSVKADWSGPIYPLDRLSVCLPDASVNERLAEIGLNDRAFFYDES